MNNKNLIILVGNIGSGKSIYAKKYQRKGYVIIARDQLRYAIGNGEYVFNYDYEDIIWKTEHYMFRKFINLGANIIIDEVGITKLMRKRYISYAKKNKYKITVIEMPRFCMKKAVKRRLKNPHGQPDCKLWEQVWTKFEGMYEQIDIKSEHIDKHVKVKKEEVS